MSVLIKGFKVPESCEDCRFCAGLADTEWGTCAGCLIDDEYREASSKSGCPLVEVPAPHGRLIDADVLKNHIENDGHTEAFAVAQIGREGKFFLMGNIIADIDEQPTVIEAERRTDEQ